MDRKLQRHHADSLRQHGFIVHLQVQVLVFVVEQHIEQAAERTLNDALLSTPHTELCSNLFVFCSILTSIQNSHTKQY